MSYRTIADIAQDGGLRRRILACAWTEDKADPEQWTADHMWPLAATPGWSEAWESSLVAHEGEEPPFQPGNDDAVITDYMILGAVQSAGA